MWCKISHSSSRAIEDGSEENSAFSSYSFPMERVKINRLPIRKLQAFLKKFATISQRKGKEQKPFSIRTSPKTMFFFLIPFHEIHTQRCNRTGKISWFIKIKRSERGKCHVGIKTHQFSHQEHTQTNIEQEILLGCIFNQGKLNKQSGCIQIITGYSSSMSANFHMGW